MSFIETEKYLPEHTLAFFEDSLDKLEMEVYRRLAIKRAEFREMAEKLNFRL